MTDRELRLRQRIDQLVDERDELRAELDHALLLLSTSPFRPSRPYASGIAKCPDCEGPMTPGARTCQPCMWARRRQQAVSA